MTRSAAVPQNIGVKLTKILTQRSDVFISLLIFATCLFVYLSSQQAGSQDTLPNSLLVFNWVEHNTLTFDNFNHPAFKYPEGDLRWFFVQAPNGHITSTYPIGPAIVTLPLYLCFSLYLKIVGLLQTGHFAFPPNLPDINHPDFETYRVLFQKLAASITTGFATVIFYSAARIKFSPAIALIGTFGFAFATSNWVTSSQALWQHTVSNLLLISLIFCFLKINRTVGQRRKILLVIAGVFCGLLPGTRPTTVLYVVAAIVYALFAYRKEAIFLVSGLCSAFLSLGWHFYYFGFGHWTGGYSRQFDTDNSSYHFTISQFIQAFSGLLVSPSRGVMLFTPVLAFSVPGAVQVWQQRQHKDEQLFACLTIATIVIFLQYCFYQPWYGDASENYGSRFLAELLPVLCFLVCYFLASAIAALSSRRLVSLTLILFSLCLFWSTFVQTVGAFGDIRVWEHAPYPHRLRLWDWQDNEIQRTANSVFFKLSDPIGNPKDYLAGAAGTIEGFQDKLGRPIASPFVVASSGRRQIIQARVKNTGTVRWFGYQTGAERGRMVIKLRFFDQNQQPVTTRRSALHLSGNANPGDVNTAVGMVEFPKAPGDYACTCDLVVQAVGTFSKPNMKPCDLMIRIIENSPTENSTIENNDP